MQKVQINDLVFFVAPEMAEAAKAKSTNTVSPPKEKAIRRKRVSQSRLILALAKAHGYSGVRMVGCGGMIHEIIETNGWLVMPAERYKGIIPPEIWQQAETLTKGINIKGFLVAEDKRAFEQRQQKIAVRAPRISPDWGKIASGIGKVAAAIAVVGATISFLPLVLGIGAIGVALAYDPLLIAVTEEDEWVCLGEWWH